MPQQEKNIPALRFPEFKDAWKEKTLKSISAEKLQNGVFNDPTKVGSGYRLINVKDMYADGYIDENKLSKLELSKKEFLNNQVIKGDTFFTRSSLVKEGIAYSNTYLGDAPDITFDGHLIRLRPDTQIVDSRFLNAALKTHRSRKEIVSHGKTGTMTTIGQEDLSRCKIYYPQLLEQQKIAAFLGAVDEKVCQLQKKKGLLEDYKKGCMQKLFSQENRFTDDNGNDFPDWEEKRIDEVFEVTRGNVLAVGEMTQEPTDDFIYPVYSSQTQRGGLTGFYNKYLYQNAITWTTDGANAGDVKYRAGKFYCTNVCGVLISDEGYANKCIAEMLNRVTHKYVSYVGNPKLMNNVMKQIKIDFPHPDEQKKIANFLSAIDKKIALVCEELDKAKTFKKGLLQQMFV